MTEIDDERNNTEIDRQTQYQRITDLENELYNFNSQMVSLHWIAKNKKPTKWNFDIQYLNDLLGRTIKLLRELKDE